MGCVPPPRLPPTHPSIHPTIQPQNRQLTATIVSAALRDFKTVVVLLIVIMVNTCIGFYQARSGCCIHSFVVCMCLHATATPLKT